MLGTPAMLPILLYSKPLPSNRITPLIGSFLLGTAMTYTPTDGLKCGHEATSQMDRECDKRTTPDQGINDALTMNLTFTFVETNYTA